MGICRRGLVWLLALTGASHTAAYHSVMDDFYYPPEEEGGEPRPPVTVSLPGEVGATVQPTKLVVMLHGLLETGNSSKAMRVFLRNHAFLVRRPGTHAPPRVSGCGSSRGLLRLDRIERVCLHSIPRTVALVVVGASTLYTSRAIPLDPRQDEHRIAIAAPTGRSGMIATFWSATSACCDRTAIMQNPTPSDGHLYGNPNPSSRSSLSHVARRWSAAWPVLCTLSSAACTHALVAS